MCIENKPSTKADFGLENKRLVIEAVLSIIKSKPFWEDGITIESNEDLPEEYLLTFKEYRDNLMRDIAKFYADKCEKPSELNSKYHICQWMKYLHSLCEQTL